MKVMKVTYQEPVKINCNGIDIQCVNPTSICMLKISYISVFMDATTTIQKSVASFNLN